MEIGSGNWAPSAKRLGNWTFRFWEAAMCIVMNITYNQVTLAKGWIFPTCGTDLLAFSPSTGLSLKTKTITTTKTKIQSPFRSFIAFRGKCFRLVLPVFVLWVHSYSPALLVLIAAAGNPVIRPRNFACWDYCFRFSLLNQTTGCSFLPVISFEGWSGPKQEALCRGDTCHWLVTLPHAFLLMLVWRVLS